MSRLAWTDPVPLEVERPVRAGVAGCRAGGGGWLVGLGAPGLLHPDCGAVGVAPRGGLRLAMAQGDVVLGGPISRTSFRARIWRPSLLRAGLLGEITPAGNQFAAKWSGQDGLRQLARFGTHDQAVTHVARHATGAPTFHSLRHCYASSACRSTWCRRCPVTRGRPPRWTCTLVRPATTTGSGKSSTAVTRATLMHRDGGCRWVC